MFIWKLGRFNSTLSFSYFKTILVTKIYNKYRARFMMFNATFNNISVTSWRSVILVEDTGVPPRKPPIYYILHQKGKMMVINSTNTNKENNPLSSELNSLNTKKTKTYDVRNPGPGLRPAIWITHLPSW